MSGKNGRPPAEIDLEELAKLCELDVTDREIAAFFRVGLRTVERRRAEDPAFADAIERGRTSGMISLRRTQHRMAQKNPAMAIWLGKQRLGQRDLGRMEISGVPDQPLEVHNGSAERDQPDQLSAVLDVLEGLRRFADSQRASGTREETDPTRH